MCAPGLAVITLDLDVDLRHLLIYVTVFLIIAEGVKKLSLIFKPTLFVQWLNLHFWLLLVIYLTSRCFIVLFSSGINEIYIFHIDEHCRFVADHWQFQQSLQQQQQPQSPYLSDDAASTSDSQGSVIDVTDLAERKQFRSPSPPPPSSSSSVAARTMTSLSSTSGALSYPSLG